MEALKKYLSHVSKREKMKHVFHTVCDFLNDMEKTYPLPAHNKLLEEWEEDIRQQWTDTFDEEGPGRKAQQVFEAVIAFRREVHQAATFQEHTQSEQQSWDWLLTAEQSEQRTEDWHKEKIDLLTASEIGALWAGPRTRAHLVLSKVPNDNPPFTSRLAVLRSAGHAMDWGVRYEPIVKTLLQTQLGITITDLGRIRHRTIPNLAASPDGLITDTTKGLSAELTKGCSAGLPNELKGRLVEIKCPPTRVINDTVPFEYWAQMQIQMEVCDRPACEYVEVKFKELEADDPETQGWITLERNLETQVCRYQYHEKPTPLTPEEGWEQVETYGWQMVHMRRVTQHRDKLWFQGIQNDLQKFWEDVQGARSGTWIPPPAKAKKVKDKKCLIMDD